MRPGDPAAIVHADTGRLDWLPVSAAEHAQIGHFELRAGRLPEALKRFDEAAAGLPAGEKADWMFFRAIALQKAGREAEAQDAWKRFEAPRAAVRGPAPNPGLAVVQPPGAQLPGSIGDGILPRHRFAAEAFVSLDMATEGIAFLRREVGDARTDRERLSASIALCQLLLLTDQRADYAECVAGDFLLLAERALKEAGSAREGIDWCVAQTLLPLAVSEFAAALPDALVRRVSEKVAAWPSGEDNTDFACQLVLRACGRQLRDQPLIARATARLSAHPAMSHWTLSAEGEVDHACLLQARLAYLAFDMFNQIFGSDVALQNAR
jgi:tetratricopeptide (TPR) repeat protein